MRGMKVEEFKTDWEYDKAKREERKSTKHTRSVRRSKKCQWTPRDADE